MNALFQPVTEQQHLQQMFALGYFAGKEWEEVKRFVLSDQPVMEAIEKYRDFHGLEAGNRIDSLMAEEMARPRCGCPDFLREKGAVPCKWPMLNVTTSHKIGGLKPLSDDLEHQAWMEAIGAWNSVCGIRLTFTSDFNAANIYATPGSTGAGVLAWSYLPCSATESTRLEQQYNRSTNWNYRLLVNVIIHEIGHAIGLDHGPKGSIMQPTAAGDITKPQTWDIEQAVQRYGKPNPQPQPPGPQPTDNMDIVLTKPIAPGRYRLIPVNDSQSDNLVMA